MANGGEGSTLRFTCSACGTHLGVDDSLAGMKAPCPKCGEVLVAPDPSSGGSRLPRSGVVRGISGGQGFRAASRERGGVRRQSSGSSQDRRSESRQVHPSGGRMPNEDEKDNMRVLIKILIATALVVLVVFLVVWFLKN